MFDLYSERSLQVIFLARLESGARGAEMIDLDDLLAALIVEDQNQIPDALERLGRTGQFLGSIMAGQFVVSTIHQPFLPPLVASNLLENVQRSAPQSQAIPTSADMGLSPALKETLAAASDLKNDAAKQEADTLAPLSGTVGRIAQGSSGTC